MTGAIVTEMRCRGGPDGEISDTKDISMYTEVVVSIVREIVIGIASYVSQIIVMVVNCWVTDCKKLKNHQKIMSTQQPWHILWPPRHQFGPFHPQ